MRPTTKHRLGRCVFGIGMSVALIATAGVPTSQAGEKGQFDSPWSFTARDRRVAIAVAIKQVEDGLLGPSRSTTNVENVVCNGPSGGASSSANFFCEVIRGDNNQIGDEQQLDQRQRQPVAEQRGRQRRLCAQRQLLRLTCSGTGSGGSWNASNGNLRSPARTSLLRGVTPWPLQRRPF